jgi:molybdopterin/thiamine biosynthesis adenylyltransferase
VGESFFSRASRAGQSDISKRVPELKPLQSATICVFGLGCIGAPSVMEFARCGVRRLIIVDHDFVEPTTICRWPFGIQAIGLPKALVLAHAIERDYPFTDVSPHPISIGVVRPPKVQTPTMQELMRQITNGASLIYDATAEVGVQQFLSEYATEIGVPYVGVEGTAGGWGGLVVRVRPNRNCSGCWLCLQHAIDDNTVPPPPSDPNGSLQVVGCADPTFTGSSFDLTQIALTAVRTAVSVLCENSEGAYPASDWDVLTASFRSPDGKLIVPDFQGYTLPKHSKCLRCHQT